ncbi:hypothetical protein LT699_11020 [Pseudomonas syringae pv. syringae]|uniref:hypothetical protein n=1 Tax=Pseudomonas syringae TaxID=317 RepID=UPI00200ABECE|nr:hypothetical protein [Pseudomonas syringae]MCK9747125.1 hypothetical protein [Pseudomonas syringae pv. syringae]
MKQILALDPKKKSICHYLDGLLLFGTQIATLMTRGQHLALACDYDKEASIWKPSETSPPKYLYCGTAWVPGLLDYSRSLRRLPATTLGGMC